MAGAPHQRHAAGPGNLVIERLAGLHIGDDRRPRPFGKHGARQHDHQLVTPQDAALPVDHADPVAIAIQRDAEVGLVLGHRLHQLFQIFRHGRVGMMIRESAVHLDIQQHMAGGQAHADFIHQRAAGAITAVPDDLQLLAFAIVAHHPVGIFLHDVMPADRARAALEIATGRQGAQALNIVTEERIVPQHHLETVIIRGVVRPGQHNPAIGMQVIDGEIQHRRRPHADAPDIDAAG